MRAIQRVRRKGNPLSLRAGSKCGLSQWSAEGVVKGKFAEYSMTWAHTSVAKDMLVSYRVHGNLP